MKRTHVPAIVALLVLASIPAIGAAVNADATISSVDVTPAQPVPGDDITVETTIANLESSSGSFSVERVAVQDTDEGTNRHADVKDIGAIGPGDSKTVPLTFSLDEGSHDLRVRVWGSDGSRLNHPLTIDVEERSPQLAIDVNDTAAGVRSGGQVTIANSIGSNISNVELTVDGEDVTVTNGRTVIATLEDGTDRTVGFDFRPESAGEHTLTATLSYTTEGGSSREVTEDVTVEVAEAHPQLDVDLNDSVAGVESEGTLTIANSLGTDITNVEVTVDGDGIDVTDDREVLTRLRDGNATTTTFDFRPDSEGEHNLTATVRYSTAGGTSRTATETVTVDAERLNDRVVLDVSTEQGGESQAVTVDVLNHGNAPVTNVTIDARSENASIRRALVERIPSGESESLTLNATLSERHAAVDVTADYDIGDRRGTTSASTDLTRAPGTIGLTGVNVRPEGGRLHVSGSASNLGSTDAESVVVRVVDTEQVTPAEPNRDFFVGTVPASDFVSFDVYANVVGNVTTVPLEVEYNVDGERHTNVVEVDAGDAAPSMGPSEEPETQESSSGGLLLPLVGALIVVAAVGALVYRAWGNSRGGD